MTNPHDEAMQDFAGELFARATAPSEIAPTARVSPPLVVKREGTLSDTESKLDRMAKLFLGELFGPKE
ncbi:MAG: hypothetical protein Q7R42_06025 [Candidatus Planktophila sp.]|nr:hypothetical protein [Candidatus Planktophila sp.]